MTWSAATLGDIAERDGGLIQTGSFRSQLHQSDYVPDGIPVIMPKDITNGRVDSASVARVSQETADRLSRHQIQPRTILLPRRGEITKRAFIRDDQAGWLCGTGCLQIALKGKHVLPEFLYYYMEQQDVARWLEQHAVGTTMLNLSARIVTEFPLRYPTLAMQHRIADILSAYDDLIENNRRRMALLDEAARQLYREWFVRLRFPGHEHTRISNRVPEGWKNIYLGDVCDTQYGYTETATDVPVGPKFLRGTDINKSPFIDWSTVPYCPIDEILQRKYQLRVGDIVIIRMADPGKVAIIERDIDAVFASYLIRLIPTDPKLMPYYLYYVLTDDAYQGFVSGVSTGSTRKTASAPLLVDYHLLLPPQGLLHEFENSVKLLRQQITTLLIQNEKARVARDLLLPRLMAGEIAV